MFQHVSCDGTVRVCASSSVVPHFNLLAYYLISRVNFHDGICAIAWLDRRQGAIASFGIKLAWQLLFRPLVANDSFSRMKFIE